MRTLTTGKRFAAFRILVLVARWLLTRTEPGGRLRDYLRQQLRPDRRPVDARTGCAGAWPSRDAHPRSRPAPPGRGPPRATAQGARLHRGLVAVSRLWPLAETPGHSTISSRLEPRPTHTEAARGRKSQGLGQGDGTGARSDVGRVTALCRNAPSGIRTRVSGRYACQAAWDGTRQRSPRAATKEARGASGPRRTEEGTALMTRRAKPLVASSSTTRAAQASAGGRSGLSRHRPVSGDQRPPRANVDPA